MSELTSAIPSGARRFEVLEALGQGAFGTVYRARMLGDGGFAKEVALKLLRTDLDPEKAEGVARRTRDEARLLGLVRHRALLHVDGLVRLGGRWAVVMELVDGCTLKDLLRTDKVPPSVALTVVREVAGGLAAAWDAPAPDGSPLHLIHRDIKPANLQLSATGDVKVLDFGVARARFDGREAETVGMMLGTLKYMAPERFDGIDRPEGDVYALGVVLAELLTRLPVAKTSGNRERHEAVVEEALGNVRAALPPEPDPGPLLALLKDTLAYDPADRPTARAVEQRTWDLARTWSEPRLPDWARVHVPLVRALVRPTDTDPFVGSVLTEGSVTKARATPSRALPVAGLAAAVLLLGLAALATLAATGFLGAAWLWQPEPVAVAPPPTPLVEPAPDVAPAEPAPIEMSPPLEPEPAPTPEPARPTPQRPVPATVSPAPTKPVPPPEPPSGTVRVSGDAAVVLSGAGGRFAPGRVPVGTYAVLATFPGHEAAESATITVREGSTVTVRCNAMLRACRAD